MDLLPENEILQGHWDARMTVLKMLLDKVPTTAEQRADIDTQLASLASWFKVANDKVTHCTKLVHGGAALCGIKLDCHIHDWRNRADMEKLVARITRRIHPQDLGAPTTELEEILRQELTNNV